MYGFLYLCSTFIIFNHFIHFKDLLDTRKDFRLKEKVLIEIQQGVAVEHNGIEPFTTGDVASAIKSMNTGKAHGIDGLSCEHFMYAGENYMTCYVCLCILL